MIINRVENHVTIQFPGDEEPHELSLEEAESAGNILLQMALDIRADTWIPSEPIEWTEDDELPF